MTIADETTGRTRSVSTAPRKRIGRRSSSFFLPVLACDLLVVAAVGAAALVGRETGWLTGDTTTVAGDPTVVAPLVLGGWLIVIAALGGYRIDIMGAGTDEYSLVARASLYAGAGFGLACYLIGYELSRGFFLLLFGLGIPALLLGRFMLRKVLQRARAHGRYVQRVVICGDATHVDDVAAVLQRDTWLGLQVVGAVVPPGSSTGETPSGIPVLGATDAVARVAGEHDADVAFFAGGSITSADAMRQTSWDLERAGVSVVLAPSMSDISAARMSIRPVGGMPLVHVDPPTWADASRWGKRTFDVVGSLGLLLLLSPVLLVVAVAVKLDDGGPVLFRQTRVGRNGRTFSCFKLRSMVPDAEARLAALHEEADFEGGLFKMEQDPRITRVGRWTRRFSVDELPQLLNVLRGDMSLIGPRPPLPSEVEGYDAGAARRLWVRPGMTGLWQVSGRARLSWDEAIRLDLYYVDNWSMVQDLTILARTVGAVLGGRGAY